MNSFTKAAITVLEKSGKPLHYREITRSALEMGWLTTDGKTPWATMMARISTDIKANGENSPFVRTEPGKFALRKKHTAQPKPIHLKTKIPSVKPIYSRGIVNQNLNSKQKGDLAENRVAELVTIYGETGLSCYRPISDDEGIDLIVKRRGRLEVCYIQVKSTWGYLGNSRGFVSTVKEKSIVDKSRMVIVFVYFDLSEGDLYEHVFCVPAPEFLRLTKSDLKNTGERVFTVGLSNPEKSKYAEYMIEKRELANRIIEIMDRL